MRPLTAAEWRQHRWEEPAWLDDPGLLAAVDGIIRRVRREGDAALRALARELDGVDLSRTGLEVPRSALEAAWAGLPPEVRAALEEARRRIEAVHRAQRPLDRWVEVEPGIRAGELWRPLERVALYAPGGRAAYPSTVLMLAVPAAVAGVGERVLLTPPGPDGEVPAVTLAAAYLAGVDRVFRVGGAQAVAAAAFGTETIPRCDAVCGPGGVYVTLAKLRLSGRIGTDLPAGPSELALVADETADPDTVAADLLCQAEHDPRARVALFTPSRPLRDAVLARLEARRAGLPRQEVLAESLGAAPAVLTRDLAEAVELADAWAPEHLALHVAEPRRWLDRVRRAGLVLLGPATCPAFADYVLGTNHVLPTAGAGRFASALGLAAFLRRLTVAEVDPAAAPRLVAATVALARAEGLPAHAACALTRLPTREPGAAPADGSSAPPPASRPGAVGARGGEDPAGGRAARVAGEGTAPPATERPGGDPA